MQFWNAGYRLFLFCNRYLRGRDALQFGMAAAAGVLAVNSYSHSRRITLIVGALYFLALALHTALTIMQRKAKDQVQGEVIWGLFHQINQEVFQNDHRTRFTLFRPAPLRPKEIVPWYRYQKGATDAIAEASRSRAHYHREEGLTGLAWAQPGDILYSPFPAHSDRGSFERFYADKLGIRESVVRDLSAHMQDVETIFCYGFEDHRGKFIGVLSLDLRAPLVMRGGNGGLAFPGKTEDDELIDIDTDAMLSILDSVRRALESFHERR
jgi:hypothetical protein